MEDKLKAKIKLDSEFSTEEDVFLGLKVRVDKNKTEINISIENIWELTKYLTERLFDEILLVYTNNTIKQKDALVEDYNKAHIYNFPEGYYIDTIDQCLKNEMRKQIRVLKEFEDNLFAIRIEVKKDFENSRRCIRNISRRINDFDRCYEIRHNELMYFIDELIEKVKKERVELEG